MLLVRHSAHGIAGRERPSHSQVARAGVRIRCQLIAHLGGGAAVSISLLDKVAGAIDRESHSAQGIEIRRGRHGLRSCHVPRRGYT